MDSKRPNILAIRRKACFSPNSVGKDRLILRLVCGEIKKIGHLKSDIRMVDEDALTHPVETADCCVSMARSDKALSVLAAMRHNGCKIVNSPQGVMSCQRSKLNGLMLQNNIPMPNQEGEHGYWLKRGDTAAQTERDVVYCPDKTALEKTKDEFRARGIDDWVVSAHIIGDLVKFYGVGERFFQYFYPNDDGISKFGVEQVNGKAHHYDFNAERLRSCVVKLAKLTGVDVYGGDVIIEKNGDYSIIDFNDWPSFSRCRVAAAKAIAMEVASKMGWDIVPADSRGQKTSPAM